jgi:hypothetical protein
MANEKISLNNDVTEFLNGLNHPFRSEIEELRNSILSANSLLKENIKWNGPNYSANNQDRITMRILPPKQIQLIFHRGAKKLEQPQNRLINNVSKLLVWKENDRAVATFKDMADIKNSKSELSKIVNDWISASI